jgi:hypothetical protein
LRRGRSSTVDGGEIRACLFHSCPNVTEPIGNQIQVNFIRRAGHQVVVKALHCLLVFTAIENIIDEQFLTDIYMDAYMQANNGLPCRHIASNINLIYTGIKTSPLHREEAFNNSFWVDFSLVYSV